jgi:SAM-dependent methyltransferase
MSADHRKPWHDDDRFWQTMGPTLFTRERWTNVTVEMDQILGLLELEDGAAVLDLCCGPGRHSLELARRGYRVTGVDLTGSYLNEARTRAQKEGLDVDFVREDMRRFRRNNAFDAAINLFTSFGYFEDPEEDRQVSLNVFQSLKPGGVLLMDLMGKEVLARIFRERHWEQVDDMFLLQECKVDRNWTWMDNRWILVKGSDRHEYAVSHRLYGGGDLVALLADCGFADVVTFGDLAGAPYDHNAKRLVIRARKPEKTM